MTTKLDRSNGWDAVAEEFMCLRSETGVSVVQTWLAELGTRPSILDIGCGHGLPLTPILLSAGASISAMDASPAMIAAYRQTFPDIPSACESVEESCFFDQEYDGILAIGLVFLLTGQAQKFLIEKVSTHLNPRGRFLFSSPRQAVEWKDLQTGRISRSLGVEVYRVCLSQCGLSILATHEDEGGNFYFSAQKA